MLAGWAAARGGAASPMLDVDPELVGALAVEELRRARLVAASAAADATVRPIRELERQARAEEALREGGCCGCAWRCLVRLLGPPEHLADLGRRFDAADRPAPPIVVRLAGAPAFSPPPGLGVLDAGRDTGRQLS